MFNRIQHLIKLNIILLIIVLIQSKNIIKNIQFQFSKSSFSQKLAGNQCAYGGGTINNSTVIQLGNCDQALYYIVLTLGSGKPQPFAFQFDTGSPTLWVPVGNPPTGFNTSQSSTYTTTTQYNNLTYGDGSYANGYMGSDILSVPGTSISANNLIQWATNVSNNMFPNMPEVSGLVGMDYNCTSASNNFLDTAFQKKQISTPVFSLQLNYANQTSYMYYNNGLPDYITSRMMWINQQASQVQYWQITLSSVTANGVDLSSVSANNAIIDSGTSAVIFNTDLYNAMINKFFSTSQCYTDANYGNTRNCYCNKTWPTFTFNVSSTQSVNLSGQYYKYMNENNAGFCYVSIFPQSDIQIVLGDVFFRGYIITFDHINSRMGFYKKPPLVINVPTIGSYNPIYFVISQFIICGINILIIVVGVCLFVRASRQLKQVVLKQVQKEMM